MKQYMKYGLALIISAAFTSCAELGRRVDEKINNLTDTANHVDSIINKEVEEIKNLDSLLLENTGVTRVDSLIETATTAIDEVASQKVETIRELVN